MPTATSPTSAAPTTCSRMRAGQGTGRAIGDSRRGGAGLRIAGGARGICRGPAVVSATRGGAGTTGGASRRPAGRRGTAGPAGVRRGAVDRLRRRSAGGARNRLGRDEPGASGRSVGKRASAIRQRGRRGDLPAAAVQPGGLATFALRRRLSLPAGRGGVAARLRSGRHGAARTRRRINRLRCGS
jgi:hypothetical protein